MPAILRYGIPLAFAALTFYALQSLTNSLHGNVPLTPPLVIAIVIALLLGSGPSLIYGIAVGLPCWVYLTEPGGSFRVYSSLEQIRLVGYFLTVFAIAGAVGLLQWVTEKLQSSAHDLAERESELHEEQRLLRLILETDPNMVFIKDWNGKFLMANQATAERYGATVENLIGKTDADFNPNVGEVARFLEDDREVMVSQHPKLIAFEPVTNPKTGVTRFFQTVKVPLPAAEGHLKNVLGLAVDITERKQSEERLAELNRTLEEKVAQRTDELKTKDVELERTRRLEVIGQLAGGIAHDFNNLLTGIMGIVQGVKSEMTDLRLEQDLEEVTTACKKASNLTRQLLTFGRRQVIVARMLDINEVISSMKTLLESMLTEDIELKTILDPNIGLVRADRSQIEQVLMNLVLNARDATPNRGRIVIETASANMASKPTGCFKLKPGPYAILKVSDTGHGMDETTLSHLYEPFFTTKGPGRGTGMGLATVYGIVKQSEGDILVYSKPGQGTAFQVFLPQIAECRTERRGPERGESPGGKETILLVEDEGIVRRVTSRSLIKRGYQVLEAENGPAALAIAEKKGVSIDLLLTDILMPGMNGNELAEALHRSYPSLRVLYMSGHIPDTLSQRGIIDPNAANFIEKSFSMDALNHKVREVLDHR
jgi:PAS domain S-box-containing protein